MQRLRRTRGRTAHQRLFRFRERELRANRQFKLATVLVTVLIVSAVLLASGRARDFARSAPREARTFALRQFGVEPARDEIEATRAIVRAQSEDNTRRSLASFFERTAPELRALLEAAGMAPANALIASGRPDNSFVLSSHVFEPADHGRIYQLRPRTRSLWLRGVTLLRGPFALLEVPDTPAMRRAVSAVPGATVDEGSAQTTNSWGCRGPEPNPQAALRGVVLGDSMMQGLFVGDDETPTMMLEHELAAHLKRDVSILNTGHLGYAPAQYFRTLRALGDRMRPHFVVVSVCPNDFGDEHAVLAGKGDDWPEATYWISEIAQWCRSRGIPYLIVPMPADAQVEGVRHDAFYPAPVSSVLSLTTERYLDLMEPFCNEHLRIRDARRRKGEPLSPSALFNGVIGDHHPSRIGTALWGRLVAQRVTILLDASGDRQTARSLGKADDK
jgi:hypothetical protein